MATKAVKSQSNSTKEQLAFEKARFEYCAKLYEKEVERSESLERRSQFYFSFNTLILGAIFLNLDFIEKIKDVLVQSNPASFVTNTLYTSTGLLALSLLLSLVSILEFSRLRKYIRRQSDKTISSLYAPDSKYLREKSEKGLYQAIGLSYAIALEFNAKITNQRARWIQISSFSTFVTVLSLFVDLGIITYLITLF